LNFSRVNKRAALVAVAALLAGTAAWADPIGSGGPDDFTLDSQEAPDPANGPSHYVTLTDGTSIALNVSVPAGCSAANPCPAIFEMSGYESGSDDGNTPAGSIDKNKDKALHDASGGASDPYDQHHNLPLQTGTRASHGVFHDDEYAVVLASVRGTGCSSGEFDLFSWRSALDGREIIDGWIAKQPWSNGDVGIFGHSYSGITGTLVAATQPRHLRVASVSGLIGDLYRDIVYPGGITNYGFPLLWTGAIRPAYDVGGGVGGGLIGDDIVNVDPICAANQARKSRTVLNDPLAQGLSDTDNDWFRARSAYSVASQIQVPFHITTAYQDEQTGPRGASTVWEHLPRTISRRMVMTNGVHGTQTDPYVRQDRLAWLDYWLLGRDTPAAGEVQLMGSYPSLVHAFGHRFLPVPTTRALIGYRGQTQDAELRSFGFPFTQTDFQERFVARDGSGKLVLQPTPAGPAGSASWAHGTHRSGAYSYQAGVNQGSQLSTPTGPDELEITMPVAADTVIAGPLVASLFVSSSAPDTELFVQLIDEDPATGEMLYLQRGMLRGSHRHIDEGKSRYFTDSQGDTVMWRPFRPHTAGRLVTPGEVSRYDVEIFPVGHVLKAGHRLVVKVSAPPADDNDYIYVPKTAPAVNTLHFSTQHPSSLLVPLIPTSALVGGSNISFPTRMCGAGGYNRMRCVTRQPSPF
jgi:uncharacterized protein